MQFDRLKEALTGIVESILVELAGRNIDYRALYPAKVVAQAADGTLDLKPDDERLGPSLTKVPIRTPAPDIIIKVQPGAYVLVGFEAGKPSAPYASLWQSGAIISMAIGGDTDAAALANLVKTEFTKIQTTLGTGSNSGGPVVFGTAYVPAASVASTKLLLGG